MINTHKKKLLTSILRTMFLQGGVQAFTIGLSALIARYYHAGDYGKFAFGMQASTLVASLACMGSANYLAMYWGKINERQFERDKKVFKATVKPFLYGFTIIVFALLLFFLLPFYSIEKVMFIGVVPIYIIMQINNFYVATQRAPIGNAIQLGRVLIALAGSVILFQHTQLIELAMLIVGLTLMYSVAVSVNMLKLYGYEAPRVEKKVYITFTYQHWVSALLVNVDVLIIRWFLEVSAVGVYSVALFFSSASTFGLYALNSNIIARISNDVNNLDKTEVQKKLTYYAKVSCLISSFFLVFLIGVGSQIDVLFGEDYSDAFILFLVLAIGQIVNVLCGSVAMLLNMCGESSTVVKVIGWTLIVKIVLGVFLVAQLGLIGMAVASSLAQIFWNVTLLHNVLRSLKLNPTIFRLNR